MSVYRDASHAISRIMSMEAIDSTQLADWQRRYESGWPEEPQSANPCPLTAEERLTQDAMTRALIHRNLAPDLWHALVAKHSINDFEVAESVRYLAPRAVTPAHSMFRLRCVTAWAVPKRRGVRDGAKTSRAGFPDSFYEIHTWDTEGTPDGSLRRWKHITIGWLTCQVDEAFKQVTTILDEKALIERKA